MSIAGQFEDRKKNKLESSSQNDGTSRDYLFIYIILNNSEMKTENCSNKILYNCRGRLYLLNMRVKLYAEYFLLYAEYFTFHFVAYTITKFTIADKVQFI